MAGLQQGLERMGGSLEAVVFSLEAPVSDRGLPDRLRERMGWTIAPHQGEERILEVQREQGRNSLILHWRLTGSRASHWVENHAALTRVLTTEGVTTPVNVQLEGEAARPAVSLLDLANSALDVLGASERQPWTSDRSASVAGHSSRLPAGPHGVNVQAASRQTAQGVRLLVAWPALGSDY
jgi:hypothetical protein